MGGKCLRKFDWKAHPLIMMSYSMLLFIFLGGGGGGGGGITTWKQQLASQLRCMDSFLQLASYQLMHDF